jgi:hypothetical protein
VKAALILSNVTCIRRAYAAYSISLQTITKSGHEPFYSDKRQHAHHYLYLPQLHCSQHTPQRCQVCVQHRDCIRSARSASVCSATGAVVYHKRADDIRNEVWAMG